jgi:hypothetical protein
MNRVWRLASGVSVFLMTLVLCAGLTVELAAIKYRPLDSSFPYFVLIVILPFVIIILSFMGSYLLIKDARISK